MSTRYTVKNLRWLYSKQHSIVFNAAKSACLLVTSSKSQQRRMHKPEFYICGKLMEFVNWKMNMLIWDTLFRIVWMISIIFLLRRNMLCGKINNVMCFFCQQNHVVKLRLMCRYCSDHYGSVLWDLNNPSDEDVCIAWRKGLRRLLWSS